MNHISQKIFLFMLYNALCVFFPYAWAQEESWISAEGLAAGAEKNPPPPLSDPKLRRSRAIPLPGKEQPRTEATGSGEYLPMERFAQSETRMPDSRLAESRASTTKRYETTKFPARNVYLNGTNISSVREQVLQNVTVEIDAEGNIKILAPHYEVGSSPSFHPLLPSELPRLQKQLPQHPDLPGGLHSKTGAWGQSKGVTSQAPEAEPDWKAAPKGSAEDNVDKGQPILPPASAAPQSPASQSPAPEPKVLQMNLISQDPNQTAAEGAGRVEGVKSKEAR